MPSEAVITFRNDLEEKLSLKRNELVATEETLKRYVGPDLGNVSLNSSLRGRLGPPPQRQDSNGGRRPLNRNRVSLESRLGPKIFNEKVCFQTENCDIVPDSILILSALLKLI